MKRGLILFFICAACMGLAGCQSAENRQPAAVAPETPIVKEKITLTALQYELDNQAIDFSNLWFFNELEKRTNIHVDFEEAKESDWTTKVNLMFASGSYRDMVLRGSLDTEEYGATQHLLIPLDDYLAEYMPNYYSRLGLNNANDAIPASDGKSYSIGFLIAQDINTNGHFFINREWLGRLGLKTPGTVEELTAVLRAFRDGDPNGNGLRDEVPWQATMNDNNTGIYNAFSFFGIPLNTNYVFIGPDEAVRFAPYCPGYRECLEWLHMLYSEGLLDAECITQSSNLWGAKVNMGTSGFFSYWRLSNTVLKPDIASRFECMLPPAAEGYKTAVPALLETAEFGAALTTANRHVPESLRWLDAQMETETMMVSQNGPLGDTLVINDEGKYQVAYVPQNNGLYSIVPVICGQFFAPADYYTKVYTMAPHRAEKTSYSRYYAEAGVMEYKSYQHLTILARKTGTQSSRLTKLYNEINKHITEYTASFITMGVTDERWAEFRSILGELECGEYLSLYQDIYDAYLGKAGSAP